MARPRSSCPRSLLSRISTLRARWRQSKPERASGGGMYAADFNRQRADARMEAKDRLLVAKKAAEHGKCSTARKEVGRALEWLRYSEGGILPKRERHLVGQRRTTGKRG